MRGGRRTSWKHARWPSPFPWTPGGAGGAVRRARHAAECQRAPALPPRAGDEERRRRRPGSAMGLPLVAGPTLAIVSCSISSNTRPVRAGAPAARHVNVSVITAYPLLASPRTRLSAMTPTAPTVPAGAPDGVEHDVGRCRRSGLHGGLAGFKPEVLGVVVDLDVEAAEDPHARVDADSGCRIRRAGLDSQPRDGHAGGLRRRRRRRACARLEVAETRAWRKPGTLADGSRAHTITSSPTGRGLMLLSRNVTTPVASAMDICSGVSLR